MAKSLVSISLKPDPYNRHVKQLVDELDERTAAIMRWLPYLVAEQTLSDIMRLAPKDVPGYPDMLELREIPLRGVDTTIGIVAPGYKFATRIKAGDESVTLLFIKANRIFDPRTNERRPVSAAAVLLAKYSPWTVGTLPFEPDRRMASIRAIRVTEREVKKIAAKRQKDLPGVQLQLQRMGVKERGAKDKLGRKVTRDVGFEVLRREFGIQARGRAHWRPAIGMAQTVHLDAALKKLLRWLTIPSERRWKENLIVKKDQASAVGRVRRFQQAVSR